MHPKIPSIIALVMVLVSACKKEHSTPAAAPEAKKHRIVVKLNSDYAPSSKIDSAIILWEINGQVQQHKMQLSNDTLSIEADKLTKGNGRLTVQLFTQIKLRQQDLQWEKRLGLNLKDNESVTWVAPTDYNDVAWLPRVIMIDRPTSFTAIVALRPADPYFLLKNIPAGYKIEVERGYYVIPGGAVSVGYGLWKCNSVCTDARGIIENREYFTPLAAQVNGREWKMVALGVGLFGNPADPGPGFYFHHY